MRPYHAILALALPGCAESTPVREQDVVDALIADVVVPMGKVAVVSRPSDCGRAEASVPGEAWTAFLAANDGEGDGLDLRGHAARLLIDNSGDSPMLIRARRGVPVVALSRLGIAGDDAVMCLEVFGAEDRGYYLVFRRDGRGRWSLRGEIEAWTEAPEDWELEPEELPDGRAYEE